MQKIKKISILGSTGSIGTQTLEVVDMFPQAFKVEALVAQRNYKLLATQAKKYQPKLVVIEDEHCYADLKQLLSEVGYQGEIGLGEAGILAAATLAGVEIVVAAISGLAGLKPVIKGIEAGKNIAFANKEVLVAAGHLVMALAKKHQVKLLPVDSEHSAIWQCMEGHNGVDSLLLTCSGGPFKYANLPEIKGVTAEAALRHPTWRMGKKITIDSATLMNKGLEIIEAHWLFDVPYDKISAVIQPESLIHSMVQFQDGALLAHLGNPDMRVPIQYALTYPERWENSLERLNFASIGQITFLEPDETRFPCLRLAKQAGRIGGSMPTVLNGVNEVLVWSFLKDRIGFWDIPLGVEKIMAKHQVLQNPDLAEILQVDAWSRSEAKKFVAAKQNS